MNQSTDPGYSIDMNWFCCEICLFFKNNWYDWPKVQSNESSVYQTRPAHKDVTSRFRCGLCESDAAVCGDNTLKYWLLHFQKQCITVSISWLYTSARSKLNLRWTLNWGLREQETHAWVCPSYGFHLKWMGNRHLYGHNCNVTHTCISAVITCFSDSTRAE